MIKPDSSQHLKTGSSYTSPQGLREHQINLLRRLSHAFTYFCHPGYHFFPLNFPHRPPLFSAVSFFMSAITDSQKISLPHNRNFFIFFTGTPKLFKKPSKQFIARTPIVFGPLFSWEPPEFFPFVGVLIYHSVSHDSILSNFFEDGSQQNVDDSSPRREPLFHVTRHSDWSRIKASFNAVSLVYKASFGPF